ncbi:hypothetical protein BC497_29395 (plasmid) [Klebsiella variicola]|nr:hypothetical protein BC497_29395 [Klebsiella variicola]
MSRSGISSWSALTDEVQAKNVAYELNGLNTDALSSAMDKQGRYEAMISFEQLKNGIRDANFAEALPVDIDSEKIQYKEIAPNTWNIECQTQPVRDMSCWAVSRE